MFQMYLRQGLYQWANDVLIPNLYYTDNYNGESSTSYEQGYLADMYSWRLGPPKLRQLRVKKGRLTPFSTVTCLQTCVEDTLPCDATAAKTSSAW